MIQARVEPADGRFRLMLGNHELGISKTDSDSRFHMHIINGALDAAFSEGCASNEKDSEELNISFSSMMVKRGGICKECGGSTTYTRQNSPTGQCFGCEFKLK
jgi:hypothetical protein